MQKKVVLLVEDEPHIAHLLERRLHDYGCHVVIVHTAKAALCLLEQFHPQLVLVDQKLPDADGRLVIKEIRRREAKMHDHIPVPVILQHMGPDDQAALSDMQDKNSIDGSVRKPYDVQTLMAAVHKALKEE